MSMASNVRRALVMGAAVVFGATAASVASAQQVFGGPAGAPTAREFPASRVLPIPTPPFPGSVMPNLIDSTPAWPPTVSVPEGAPNVLLILIDDAGFASNSAFGGIVAKPTIDRLAREGLRYTQMHNTALCSPSARARTGRRARPGRTPGALPSRAGRA
jgi:hypothetical protein